MLSLSKKTDYALLALSYLARIGAGRAANTKEIAEEYAIPVELLAKILQKLAKERLVISTAGPTGGYRLARPAAEISVGAIIEAIDGPLAIAHCMKIAGNRCEQLTRRVFAEGPARALKCCRQPSLFFFCRHNSCAPKSLKPAAFV